MRSRQRRVGVEHLVELGAALVVLAIVGRLDPQMRRGVRDVLDDRRVGVELFERVGAIRWGSE